MYASTIGNNGRHQACVVIKGVCYVYYVMYPKREDALAKAREIADKVSRAIVDVLVAHSFHPQVNNV